MRSSRRAGLRATGIAAVAGAAAATVLVAGVLLSRPDPAPVPAVPTEDVAVVVERLGIEADADLVDHTWGVEVLLSGSGFDEGHRDRVTVLGAAGRRFAAGEFVGTGDREMLCNLSSSVLRREATGFEVRDWKGRVVVTSTFA